MAIKIKYNIAKCNKCKDIIESKYRHDFVECRCGAIFVDGGKNYLRRGYQKEEDITELSTYEDDIKYM